MVRGAEKFHRLLSARWRPGRARGVVPVESWRPEQGGSWWKPQSESKGPDVQWQEKMAALAQAESIHRFPAFLFYFVLDKWDDAHPHWWDRFSFSLLIQMLTSSANTFRDTPRNNVFPTIQAPLRSVKRTPKINCHHHPLVAHWVDLHRRRHSYLVGFTGGSAVEHLLQTQEMRATGFQSLGREHPPGVGNGNLFRYSCLENVMDWGTWWLQSGGRRVGHSLATEHKHTQP